MEWIKKAPPWLVVTVLVAFVAATIAYLGGYVYLTAQGVDTVEYRGLLNTTFNYVMILFTGTGAVASISAARSANTAVTQTNGTLTARDEEITRLRAALGEDVQP